MYPAHHYVSATPPKIHHVTIILQVLFNFSSLITCVIHFYWSYYFFDRLFSSVLFKIISLALDHFRYAPQFNLIIFWKYLFQWMKYCHKKKNLNVSLSFVIYEAFVHRNVMSRFRLFDQRRLQDVTWMNRYMYTNILSY